MDVMCDHYLVVIDESFDHGHGCEQLVFYECAKCGATHEEDKSIPETV